LSPGKPARILSIGPRRATALIEFLQVLGFHRTVT
jgi:hypothetical protein